MKKIKKIKKITEKEKLTKANKISFFKRGLDRKKIIVYFLISFFVGITFGYFILSKKTLISSTQTVKKNNSSFSNQWFFNNQVKSNEIKNQLNQLSSIYIDPLDLIDFLKKPDGQILLVDLRDQASYQKEHIKTAVIFKDVNQIKKLSKNGEKQIVVYGNFQGEGKVYQQALNLINQGLKVKILSIGYNQFRHLKIFWLPQSQWDKVEVEEWIDYGSVKR
jgi:rhodanese-related sulfurtransferase